MNNKHIQNNQEHCYLFKESKTISEENNGTIPIPFYYQLWGLNL